MNYRSLLSGVFIFGICYICVGQNTTDAIKGNGEIKNVQQETNNGFINLDKTIKALPNLLKDSGMAEKLAAIKLNTTFFTLNTDNVNNLFGMNRLPISDYLDKLNGINKRYLMPDYYPEERKKLKKIGDLQKQTDLWELIQNKLSSDDKSLEDFRNEFKDLDNEIYKLSDSEFSTGQIRASGNTTLCCSSGIIIISTTQNYEGKTIVIIIPRDVLLHAVSFGWTGGTLFMPQLPRMGVTKADNMYIITENGEKYYMPTNDNFTTANSQASMLQLMTSAFNIHQTLHALNQIKSSLVQGDKITPINGTKLMGYSGISIGMNQKDVLDQIRTQIDYSEFNAPTIFNYFDNNTIRDKQSVVDLIKDICTATGGIVLSPPWTVLLIKALPEIKNKPLDIFIFVDDKLVMSGRYFGYRISNTSLGNNSDISLPIADSNSSSLIKNDNIDYKALFEKYSDNCQVQIGIGREPYFSPSGVLRVAWEKKDGISVGAIFRINTGNSDIITKAGELDFKDNLIKAIHIPKHIYLFPWDLKRIDTTNFIPLVYIYYWSEESSNIIKTKTIEFIKNIQKTQSEDQKNKIDNSKNNL